MKVVKLCLVLALAGSVMLIYVPKLYADETSEVILKILIKKGIITQEEVDQMKAEIAKEKPEVPETLEERVTKIEKELPSWVKNTKWKGDLRLRNEYIDNQPGKDRTRQRVRFRYGFETKVNDKLKVGARFVSGSSDAPTSTNQTLEQEFQKKQVWFDQFYAKYTPYDWLHLVGGKFKNPFFHTDMTWDSDIYFDGGAATAKYALNDPDSSLPTSGYLTLGAFPIDERSNSERDLWLFGFQAGTETEFKKQISEEEFQKVASLKTGLAYYNFHSLEGYSGLAESAGTNTTSAGAIAYDFRVINPTAKLTFNKLFNSTLLLTLIGDYAHNTAAPSNDEAWRLGLQLGKKVKDKGQWRLLGQYTRIQTDAFPDSFPDSDFNSGGTNAKGWEVIFDYGLAKNVIFGIDYYNTEVITGSAADQQILQTDLIFKF